MSDDHVSDIMHALHAENAAYLQRMLEQEAEIVLLRAQVQKLRYLVANRHRLDPVEMADLLDQKVASSE